MISLNYSALHSDIILSDNSHHHYINSLFYIIAGSAVFTAVQIGPESRSRCFRSIYCILQLILCFYSPHLKKVLEMVSFGPQTSVMSNKCLLQAEVMRDFIS